MGVTIKDVAKKTGLSVTAVSLVLNKKESRISEKTKLLIESAAQELNYTPNQTAISLVTKKTQTIGLILPQGGYYCFADLVRSVESACKNAGYFLMLSLVGTEEAESLTQIDSLIHRGVDGIIFDPSATKGITQELITAVQQSVVPVVALGCLNAQLLPNSITPEHRRGGYLAASHLLELGHRRLGYIGGPMGLSSASDFFRGYREAIEDFGAAVNSIEIEGPYSCAAGVSGGEQLLRKGITAIAAGSDLIARGVFRAAQAGGVSVPRRLSVVGYGDAIFSADTAVSLTTIMVHFDRIARKAVNIIRKNDTVPGAASPEVITPTLIVRESTAEIVTGN